MKIAIPTVEGKLCTHFGHCQQFCIIDVDKDNKIVSKVMMTPPAHEPGVLPRWLGEQKVTHILAGGMGMRAQELFIQNKITVVTGVQGEHHDPEDAVTAYLAGSLQTGTNACDH